MKKFKISLSLLLSLLSLNSFAIGWSTPTTITGYYVYSNNTAYIRVANVQNPDNCTSNYNYVAIDTTQANFKSIWAQVIAAQASGQTASLYYSGCLGGYPLVGAIAIPSIW